MTALPRKYRGVNVAFIPLIVPLIVLLIVPLIVVVGF
jgi:hypothetical protein